MMGTQSYGWCSVATVRFENNGVRVDFYLAQLFSDQKSMFLVADYIGRVRLQPLESEQRVLEHRPIIDESQKLFRVKLSGERPQARTGPTRKSYR